MDGSRQDSPDWGYSAGWRNRCAGRNRSATSGQYVHCCGRRIPCARLLDSHPGGYGGRRWWREGHHNCRLCIAGRHWLLSLCSWLHGGVLLGHPLHRSRAASCVDTLAQLAIHPEYMSYVGNSFPTQSVSSSFVFPTTITRSIAVILILGCSGLLDDPAPLCREGVRSVILGRLLLVVRVFWEVVGVGIGVVYPNLTPLCQRDTW